MSADDELTRRFYAMSPTQRRPSKEHVERAIVPPWEAPPRTRAAAQRALDFARAELEMSEPVTIRWMVQPPRTGLPRISAPKRQAFVEPIAHPTEVFLLVTVRDPVETVLHETRHLWQWANGWYPEPRVCDVDGCGHLIYELSPADEDRLELDAYRWAAIHERFV